jgi:hypothetical protein
MYGSSASWCCFSPLQYWVRGVLARCHNVGSLEAAWSSELVAWIALSELVLRVSASCLSALGSGKASLI